MHTLLVTWLLVLVSPPAEGQRPPRPPREAIDACVDLEAGDACSFEGRNQETVDGICFAPDEEKPLACRPKNPPLKQ